jgi:hypothetical protein
MIRRRAIYLKNFTFVKQSGAIIVIKSVKKGVSIILVLFMLTAMVHITVATHYCKGEFAALKISLAGKLASCGMEDPEKKLPPSGTYFTGQCCKDIVTSCKTDSNYAPSTCLLAATFQNNYQILSFAAVNTVYSAASPKPIFTSVSPPRILKSTDVDLSDICVYRM